MEKVNKNLYPPEKKILITYFKLQGRQVFFGMDMGCGQGNTYQNKKVQQNGSCQENSIQENGIVEKKHN